MWGRGRKMEKKTTNAMAAAIVDTSTVTEKTRT